jgi:hypothetical protein
MPYSSWEAQRYDAVWQSNKETDQHVTQITKAFIGLGSDNGTKHCDPNCRVNQEEELIVLLLT